MVRLTRSAARALDNPPIFHRLRTPPPRPRYFPFYPRAYQQNPNRQVYNENWSEQLYYEYYDKHPEGLSPIYDVEAGIVAADPNFSLGSPLSPVREMEDTENLYRGRWMPADLRGGLETHRTVKGRNGTMIVGVVAGAEEGSGGKRAREREREKKRRMKRNGGVGSQRRRGRWARSGGQYRIGGRFVTKAKWEEHVAELRHQERLRRLEEEMEKARREARAEERRREMMEQLRIEREQQEEYERHFGGRDDPDEEDERREKSREEVESERREEPQEEQLEESGQDRRASADLVSPTPSPELDDPYNLYGAD